MATMDIFEGDAFTIVELTRAGCERLFEAGADVFRILGSGELV